MSQKFAAEFREVADKYISGPQSKMLCMMMAQSAFIQQNQKREEVEGGRVVGALFTLMERTIEMSRKVREKFDADREEMKDDEPDEEAPSLA